MLSVGLLYSLLTGVCWSLIAVILSCSARSKKLDIVSYSLLQSALVAAACFFCFSSPGKMEFNSGFYMLCLIILSAAVLNAFAQYLVKRSRSGGHYAPVWALAQAALIFPYLLVFSRRGKQSWNSHLFHHYSLNRKILRQNCYIEMQSAWFEHE